MSKTPYEIRAELLNLSFNILSSSVEKKNMKDQMEWQIKMDDLKGRHSVDPNDYAFPEMQCVTTEQIVEEAKKLNRFVSEGN